MLMIPKTVSTPIRSSSLSRSSATVIFWVIRNSGESSGYANSPPKLGGVDAHQENVAKPPFSARPGWFLWAVSIWSGEPPVCAASERDLLLSGAATPPNLGGELCSLQPYILQKSSHDIVKLLRLLRVTQVAGPGNHLQPRSGRHFIPHRGYLILGAPDQ